MQPERVLAGIAAIAAPALAVDPAAITLDTPLRDRVDSLAMIDLVVAAEDAFGVRIPDEDAERFETVGDVVQFIGRATPG